MYIHNEILWSNLKRMKSFHLQNMDKSRGHYVKWNKTGKRKTNLIWFHLYVEAKKKTLKIKKK